MATYAELYRLARQSLLLGTHRRPPPAALTAAYPELGVEDHLSPEEQLLEATTLLDRLRRLDAPSAPKELQCPEPPPPDSRTSCGPKSAGALQLALGNTYRPALPELVGQLNEKGVQPPAHLLVQLLEITHAAWRTGERNSKATPSQRGIHAALLALGGERARWLAAQHPEWSGLLPPSDPAAAYQKVVTPTDKLQILWQWRTLDPDSARAALMAEWPGLAPKNQESRLAGLLPGLGSDDWPFLRSALGPRRRDVRRLAARLLLKSGEPDVSELLTEMAGAWYDPATGSVTPDPDHRDILENYGFWRKAEGLERSLIANLPPSGWLFTSDRSPQLVVSDLLGKQPKLLPALIEACVFYEDSALRTELVRYLIGTDRPQSEHSKTTLALYHQLTAAEYREIAGWATANIEGVMRRQSVLRRISLEVPHPWPDGVAKAIVNQFTDQLEHRMSWGYTPDSTLRVLPYRIDVALLEWLRQRLRTLTARTDQVGGLATKMLQVVHFRRTARAAIAANE